MEILAIQTDIAWEDRETNFARINALLSSIRVAPGSLLALPELFAVGFSMNTAKVADTASRETEVFLADLAKRYQSFVVGGVAAKAGRTAANESVTFSPAGKRLGRYRKMHPFSAAGEAAQYVPGNDVEVFECDGFALAPFVCYDLRFPEIFRAAEEQGANLFVVIANWPAPRIAHWTTLLKARAIENLAFVVGVNRVGTDPSHSYPGKSLIVNPHGEVLAEAGAEACVLRAKCDPRVAADWRLAFPALRDRREEFRASRDDESAGEEEAP